MADVFISYVEEDNDVAIALSEGLEAAGYTTWCYERHSVPGPSYLAQTREAIERSRIFLLVVSRDSLGSFQIDKEVVRAHEAGKRFVPVLRGVTHAEFHARQPEWGQAAGGATGIQIRDDGAEGILPRIIRGLQTLRLEPSLPPLPAGTTAVEASPSRPLPAPPAAASVDTADAIPASAQRHGEVGVSPRLRPAFRRVGIAMTAGIAAIGVLTVMAVRWNRSSGPDAPAGTVVGSPESTLPGVPKDAEEKKPSPPIVASSSQGASDAKSVTQATQPATAAPPPRMAPAGQSVSQTPESSPKATPAPTASIPASEVAAPTPSAVTAPARPTPGSRRALVIGNSLYPSAPLRTPGNDARLVSDALRTVGFDVRLAVDLGYGDMRRLIDEFGARSTRDSVGVFYFSGHGIQVSGRNYLIPINAELNSEADVEVESVDVAVVLARMNRANSMNIVVIDACRTNPYARQYRSLGGGLAALDLPQGMLLAYATAPGGVAEDGGGANSPYSAALARTLVIPGLRVEEVFKRVRQIVRLETSGRQVPWETSSIIGDFVFSAPR